MKKEKIENNINEMCQYCNQYLAQYYIGVLKKPCCQDNPNKCPGVIAKNQKHGKATKKQRYGSETYNNSQKRAETNIKRYGNVCSLHGKEQEEKTKQTWLKNYGYENRLDSPDVQAQMSQAVFDKHRVYNAFQIPEVIQQIQFKNSLHQEEITAKAQLTKFNKTIDEILKSKEQTQISHRIKRYAKLSTNSYVIPMFTLDEFISCKTTIYDTLWTWKCLKCGSIFQSTYSPFHTDIGNIYGRCLKCFPKSKTDGISRQEIELAEFIKSIYHGKIETSKHILKNSTVNGSHGLQIDIFLPELKIGIEYNGLYFHQLSNKGDQYHLYKTTLAEDQGIKLVHIRSDQWINNTEETKKFLNNFINNNLQITDFYQNNEQIIVDRALFNKCCIPNNYKLIKTIAPQILQCKETNSLFEYEDCGYLIYQKQT